MKLVKVFVVSSFLFGSLFASEFISYDDLSKKLKEEAKQSGMMATTQEVKDALLPQELLLKHKLLNKWDLKL